MASKETRSLCLFFLLALSFSLQTQARDSKFFSKVSHNQLVKNTNKINTQESISSISPTQSAELAPAHAPESVVETEHGYGLYGNEAYRYPPTTADPVKTTKLSEEELFTNNFNGYENNGNGNGNGYVTEKQGMSDTKFLENGKYYYDISQDTKKDNSYKGNGFRYGNGNGNGNGKQGMSEFIEDENSYSQYELNRNGNGNGYAKKGMSELVEDENRYPQYNLNGNGNGYGNQGRSEFVEDENSYPHYRLNGNGNGNGYRGEKQGMSDTRFLENGKYYYDINKDAKDKNSYKGNDRNGNGYPDERQKMSEYVADENSYPEYELNGNGNGNGYVTEKQGMSDTRFLENGRYYYDVNAEKLNNNNGYENRNGYGNHKNRNEYENMHIENENENNGYVSEVRGSYNYNPNEHTTEGRGGYTGGHPKRLPPNEYDTMEEYEKEQEYKHSQNDEYVP